MIPTWVLNLAKGRNVVIALVLWLIYSLLLFNLGPYSALRTKADANLLEERFGYSQAEVQKQLHDLGEEGRTNYRNFQLLDGLNGILMAAALTLALGFALGRLFADRNPIGSPIFSAPSCWCYGAV